MNETVLKRSQLNTPLSASQKCVLHTHHGSSTPYYTEMHHVLPQAWQEFWWPAWNNDKTAFGPVSLPLDEPKAYMPIKRIWDPLTEPLCPNGHRNVHYLIVRLMKAWALYISGVGAAQSNEPITKVIERELHLMRLNRVRVNMFESKVAASSLWRWHNAGGVLKDLTDAHLFGNA